VVADEQEVEALRRRPSATRAPSSRAEAIQARSAARRARPTGAARTRLWAAAPWKAPSPTSKAHRPSFRRQPKRVSPAALPAAG